MVSSLAATQKRLNMKAIVIIMSTILSNVLKSLNPSMMRGIAVTKIVLSRMTQNVAIQRAKSVNVRVRLDDYDDYALTFATSC